MSNRKSYDKISLVSNSSNTQLEIEFSKTQLEILYAAEIIMGQKGIENTSHRDIINLAGQKNTSAILYHFGSIEGVVNALFELRMKVQNQERSELLEIILNQEDYSNMDLMDAYINPLFNKVFHDPSWSNWIYFLQNLIISTNGKKNYANKYRKAATEIEELFAKKNYIEKISAAVHPFDKTCRPQFVSKLINPEYHNLISEFKKISKIGVLLNTSFNLHGEPIVCHPKEAFVHLDNNIVDILVINNKVYSNHDRPRKNRPTKRSNLQTPNGDEGSLGYRFRRCCMGRDFCL